jgi:hypothetical protein
MVAAWLILGIPERRGYSEETAREVDEEVLLYFRPPTTVPRIENME